MSALTPDQIREQAKKLLHKAKELEQKELVARAKKIAAVFDENQEKILGVLSEEDRVEAIRKFNRKHMPDFMHEYEKKMQSTPVPLPNGKLKRDFIREILVMFDKDMGPQFDLYLSWKCPDPKIEILLSSSISALSEATRWVLDHFAEIDLGGSMKWFGCLITILKYRKRGLWPARENSVFLDYSLDTRWGDREQE